MPINLLGRVHLSLNDSVRVQLTEFGLAVAHKQRLDHSLRGSMLETQLWTLMQAFGEDIHMGGPQLFVNNRIDIVEPQPIEV